LCISSGIIAVRTMLASTLTTIAAFEVILSRKTTVSFWREVVIAILYGDVFFHI
jgi:hypothetical protein